MTLEEKLLREVPSEILIAELSRRVGIADRQRENSRKSYERKKQQRETEEVLEFSDRDPVGVVKVEV